jgi:rSAM/selenodomain-associated transferase 2
MTISMIIPTLNEADNIGLLLHHLNQSPDKNALEIIVADGQSVDGTVEKCREFASVRVILTARGRAVQMNEAAMVASGEVLYFVHADTRPPLTFYSDIRTALGEGYDLGCYRFRFDSPRTLLKINNFFTRFDRMWVRGGDQSLFMTRDSFVTLGGYRKEYVIMEEYDLIQRARDHGLKFKVIPGEILVSARKYQGNSYLRVQLANLIAFNMFRFGFDPQRILNTYRRMIHYRS